MQTEFFQGGVEYTAIVKIVGGSFIYLFKLSFLAFLK